MAYTNEVLEGLAGVMEQLETAGARLDKKDEKIEDFVLNAANTMLGYELQTQATLFTKNIENIDRHFQEGEAQSAKIRAESKMLGKLISPELKELEEKGEGYALSGARGFADSIQIRKAAEEYVDGAKTRYDDMLHAISIIETKADFLGYDNPLVQSSVGGLIDFRNQLQKTKNRLQAVPRMRGEGIVGSRSVKVIEEIDSLIALLDNDISGLRLR